MPLKRSPEYGMIRPRVADLRPVDSWQQDTLHFFVFQLQGDADAAGGEAALAVFAMHPEWPGPVSAVVVTPDSERDQAEVVDLRRPDAAYIAPLSI